MRLFHVTLIFILISAKRKKVELVANNAVVYDWLCKYFLWFLRLICLCWFDRACNGLLVVLQVITSQTKVKGIVIYFNNNSFVLESKFFYFLQIAYIAHCSGKKKAKFICIIFMYYFIVFRTCIHFAVSVQYTM